MVDTVGFEVITRFTEVCHAARRSAPTSRMMDTNVIEEVAGALRI